MKFHKTKIMAILSILASAGVASAQTQTSTQEGIERENTLRDEAVGVIPQVGVLGVVTPGGGREARGTVGLGFDFNFAPGGTDYNESPIFFGLSTGGFYSHIGASNSSFFGASSSQSSAGGANMVIIPGNLKLGVNIGDSFRVSAHGGGNVIYRSQAGSVLLGDGSSGSDSLWKVYPNVGADLELQVGNNVAIIARPDVTITPGSNMWMGTIGATILSSL